MTVTKKEAASNGTKRKTKTNVTVKESSTASSNKSESTKKQAFTTLVKSSTSAITKGMQSSFAAASTFSSGVKAVQSNGNTSAKLIENERTTTDKNAVVTNGTSGDTKSSSDVSTKLIIAESSGAVANGSVSSSAVTETATTLTSVTESGSSSKVIESVSTVVTGGTSEFIATSESQKLQQGTAGHHSALATNQTLGEKSVAVNQENVKAKDEVAQASGSGTKSSSTIKKETASSSCNTGKSLINETSSDIRNVQSKQELNESLAVAENVKNYVQESSSSVTQVSQSKHESVSSSSTSEVVISRTAQSSSDLKQHSQQESLTACSVHHSETVDSSEQHKVAMATASSVTQGFATSSSFESNQKHVSSGQSLEAVESVSQQKLITGDSSSSVQQAGSTVQHSTTVVTEEVQGSKAAVTATSSTKTTSKSNKKAVTGTDSKVAANKADLAYKYSGPIKEQCICEICTCG
jgi:hypothetical protein